MNCLPLYREQYGGVYPIWVASEMMTFGTISKFYANMHRSARNDFSKQFFNVDKSFLTSWLRCLINVRNVCAHFARLYGRQLKFAPKILSEERSMVFETNSQFAAFIIARRLCEPWSEWKNFVTNLTSVIGEYDQYIDVTKIGFPDDWENLLTSVPR